MPSAHPASPTPRSRSWPGMWPRAHREALVTRPGVSPPAPSLPQVALGTGSLSRFPLCQGFLCSSSPWALRGGGCSRSLFAQRSPQQPRAASVNTNRAAQAAPEVPLPPGALHEPGGSNSLPSAGEQRASSCSDLTDPAWKGMGGFGNRGLTNVPRASLLQQPERQRSQSGSVAEPLS